MTDEGCCGTPESGLLSDLICFDGTMSAVLDCSLAEQITPCGSYHDSISAQCVRMILVRVGFPLIQFSSISIRVFMVGVRFRLPPFFFFFFVHNDDKGGSGTRPPLVKLALLCFGSLVTQPCWSRLKHLDGVRIYTDAHQPLVYQCCAFSTVLVPDLAVLYLLTTYASAPGSHNWSQTSTKSLLVQNQEVSQSGAGGRGWGGEAS